MSIEEVYRKLSLHPTARDIRVLEVLKDEYNGHLQCRMQKASLNSEPRYYALSYTWGGGQDQSIIYVNERPVQVRANLYSFLREVQRRRLSWFEKSWSWLWIDSLCIDQSNVSERNQQVQRMGDIYSQASHVIVWLGQSTADTAAVFRDVKSPLTPVLRSLQFRYQYQSKSKMFETEITDRPYWKRLWVMQEFLLARDIEIVCGCYTMTWQQLRRYLPLRDWGSHRPSTIYLTIADIFQSFSLRPLTGSASQEQDLVDLIRRFVFKECLDPRDKIFGVQNLVPEEDRVRVDYAISREELFSAVLRVLALKARRFQKYLESQRDPLRAGPASEVDICLILRVTLNVHLEGMSSMFPDDAVLAESLTIFDHWDEYMAYLEHTRRKP